MPYTQADIDSLRIRIATGTKTLRHGDTLRENYDITQLIKLLEMMELEVNGRGARYRTLGSFRSGA